MKRYDHPVTVEGCVQERLADDAPDPTTFRQFAVQEPGGEPKQYGDRSYVQYGDVLHDSAPGSVIVERDVEVLYGPWRPLDTEPFPEPEFYDVDPIDVQDGDEITVTGTAQLTGNHIDINDSSGMCIGTAFRAMGEPITVRRRAIPLPTNEGAVIRCLIHGLDGPRVAEMEDGTWLTTGIDRSYGCDQIARVLVVLDEGKAS
jgi:hypothetical protein